MLTFNLRNQICKTTNHTGTCVTVHTRGRNKDHGVEDIFNDSKQGRAGQDGAGRGRAGQGRTGQGGAGQGRADTDRNTEE